jgi:hypothetical protein
VCDRFGVERLRQRQRSKVHIALLALQIADEAIARFITTLNPYVAVLLDLGPEGEQVFLVLFGSGLRACSALANAAGRIGGVEAELQFIGAQGSPWLDQVILQRLT